MSETQDLRYPIGKFMPPTTISREDRRASILAIDELPAKLSLVSTLRNSTRRIATVDGRFGRWCIILGTPT
jgi:hypothetical protein